MPFRPEASSALATTPPVPDAVAGTPYRYKGAHTAVLVTTPEEFRLVQESVAEFGGFDEGDHRAALRRPGELSTYFYDPSGNRLQLVIIPATS